MYQTEPAAQLQEIHRENTEIQREQVQLLKKMALPIPKPPVFDGNIMEYPKWESAFDALIEKETINPSHKLYYLGEYTSGTAAKMISGLLGLRTEDAYQRARKMLTERFGNPFKIYEAYREKLKSWPICTSSAQLQEYSDFLVMTQETMKTVKYLNEFDKFSALRDLAARLPNHYCIKWTKSAKKIEESQGEYKFQDLVKFAQEASQDANQPFFSHQALSAVRKDIKKEATNGTDNPNTVTNSESPTDERKTACVLCNETHKL